MIETFVKYAPDCEFPIQNLPYGVFTSPKNEDKHIGVAIGNLILDLHSISHLFDGPLLSSKQHVFQKDCLNDFMALGRPYWVEARETLQKLLDRSNPLLQQPDLNSKVFIRQDAAIMHVPANIGDYTDFYSSMNHAVNVGSMFRNAAEALKPNWKYLPVGYHGRSSSIVVSGTPIKRPYGQTCPAEGQPPKFGPCERMDFELEVAFFVGGPATNLGQQVPASAAYDHIFGLVLMNDWSARDIQKWEYIPLGPFGSKNLGTTISPWIVTMEALEPFKLPNPKQDPKPFPYLQHNNLCSYDIKLEVSLKTSPVVFTTISRSNYKNLYWTAQQQLAHHTVTGCNIRPGDLMASGTISGSTEDSYGSLLELAWNGSKPIKLTDGTSRTFLQDNDEVIINGYCVGENYRIGFGQCTGKLLPANWSVCH